jgi:O-antigen/teichoic acid export membrane protein
MPERSPSARPQEPAPAGPSAPSPTQAGAAAAYSDGNVAAGAAITFSGAALGGVLALVNEALVARYLGLGAYGFYALAMALTRVGEVLALCGLRASILHFIPLHRRTGDTGRLAGVVRVAVLWPLLSGSLLGTLLWLSAPMISSHLYHDPAVTQWIRLLALLVPLLAGSELLGNICRGFGLASPYVLIRNVTPQVTLTLLLGALLLIRPAPSDGGYRVLPFALSLLTAHCLAVIIGLLAVRRLSKRELDGARPRYEQRRLLGYAMPVLATTGMYMVIGWTDLIVLGATHPAEEAGRYRACMQLVIVLEMVAVAFNAAAAQVFPVLFKEQRLADLNRVFRRITRWLAPSALVAALTLAVNAEAFLAVLGPAFVGSARVLFVLSAAHAVQVVFGLAGFLAVITGNQGGETRNAFISAVLNLSLNLLLVPAYGALGAATATAVSLIVFSGLRVRFAYRFAGVTPPWWHLLRSLLSLAAIALVSRWLLGMISAGDTGALQLAWRVPIAGGAIALGAFALLDPAERSAFIGRVAVSLGRRGATP